jgi:glycine cleavage system H protein
MLILEDLKYTEEHMWARNDGKKKITIGITDYAQKKLGDVVYIELPEEGEDLIKDEPFGSIESSESVSDLHAPLSGEVIEINEERIDSPEIVNDDPYEEGWLIRIKVPSLKEYNELMSADEYREYVQQEELEELEELEEEELEEEELEAD